MIFLVPKAVADASFEDDAEIQVSRGLVVLPARDSCDNSVVFSGMNKAWPYSNPTETCFCPALSLHEFRTAMPMQNFCMAGTSTMTSRFASQKS